MVESSFFLLYDNKLYGVIYYNKRRIIRDENFTEVEINQMYDLDVDQQRSIRMTLQVYYRWIGADNKP